MRSFAWEASDGTQFPITPERPERLVAFWLFICSHFVRFYGVNTNRVTIEGACNRRVPSSVVSSLVLGFQHVDVIAHP